MEKRYNANKTGDNTEPCPTLTSTLNKKEKKLFQK